MNKLLLTAVFFLLFDGSYLYLTNSYFQKQIYSVQSSATKVYLWKLILTYVILILGYYYFVILKKLSLQDTFLLGVFIYAVYEFTNYSIFNEWKWTTVLLDTFWGGLLFVLTRHFVNFIK